MTKTQNCSICGKLILATSQSGLCKEHYVEHITGKKKIKTAKICQYSLCNELIINSKNHFCNETCRTKQNKLIKSNSSCPIHNTPFLNGFCMLCVESKRQYLVKKKIINTCEICGTQLFSRSKTKCTRCMYAEVHSI